MVERLNGIQEVAGSTPTISTKQKGLSAGSPFCLVRNREGAANLLAVDRQFAVRQILAEGIPLAGNGKLSPVCYC